MEKIKCHICKAKNKEIVCGRCGADLSFPLTEQIVLTSGGYTFLNDNRKNIDRFSSCKVSFTNKRLVIYKIKPEADNPAFGLLKDLANAIVKNPYISISLNDIKYIRRYDTKHMIHTNTDVYCVLLSKSKDFDRLFESYKQPEEK